MSDPTFFFYKHLSFVVAFYAYVFSIWQIKLWEKYWKALQFLLCKRCKGNYHILLLNQNVHYIYTLFARKMYKLGIIYGAFSVLWCLVFSLNSFQKIPIFLIIKVSLLVFQNSTSTKNQYCLVGYSFLKQKLSLS